MAKFSKRQYQRHVMAAMTVYVGLMAVAWPLVRTTSSLPVKVLLAVLAATPVIYVMAQLVRLIRHSDELERLTHLVALSVATGVVSALSLIGGFLSSAGVLQVDGAILIWVFPVIVICYALVRGWVSRRYGGSLGCEDGPGIKQALYVALLGAATIVVALLFGHSLNAERMYTAYGMGATLMVAGLALAAVRRYRRNYRDN
jgi:hypothetical protein